MNDDLAAILVADRQILQDQWLASFRIEPPLHTHASFMRLALAWQYQAGSKAGVSVKLPSQPPRSSSQSPSHLRPGTKLIREWRGITYHVIVAEQGFDYGGKRYRSLSAIAQTITGSHRSGLAFFGVGR